jgi:CelD/BcsL family acetyltransferase involved in cellulose biosynthesis
VRTELLTSDAALAALAPEWNALWRRSAATPFQSPAWLLAWWAAFGTGQPRVALLRDGDELIGVLPLYLLQEGGERKLLPVGVGITDYNDALLGPGAPPGAVAMLLAAGLGLAHCDRVTSCDLPDLPTDAALRDASPPAGWRQESWVGEPCPVLVLPGAMADAVPKGTLRNLRMSRHRAERIGGWCVQIAEGEAIGLAWDTLVRLHQARWTRQQQTGVLADPNVLAFHRAALPLLAADGSLRLYVLRFGDTITAVYHTLAAGPDRLLFYLSGFDAAHAFESPGTILLGAITEQAILEGRRELHFLRGAEAYKYAWGAQNRHNIGRRLLPPS